VSTATVSTARTPLRLAPPIIAIALLATLNVMLLTLTDWTMLRGGSGADWTIFGEAGRRVMQGGALYASEDNYAFRYSPLLAYAFAALTGMGPLLWRVLHVAAAASLSLRSPWLAAAVLVSWPFWFDVEAGNLMIFVLVLAAWALSGRGWAIGAFLVLTLLAPRPLMLPVAVWLLWQHPEWRLRFAAIFAIHGAAVLLTGWALPWMGALVGSSSEMGSILNYGPSRIIGIAWIPIGLGLAAFFTWRRRLGLASLAASPYWLPYYLLMLFLEAPSIRADAERAP
jgi:hypothetical protein